MAPLLRLQPFTYPYSAAQLRADEPRLSLSAELPDRELAALANLDPPVLVVRVTETSRPPDTRAQRWDEGQPVEQDGEWVQTWTEREATQEEIDAWDAQHAPPPEWIAFSEAIVAIPSVAQVLAAAFTANPGLYGGLVVGLGQAAQGDPRTFLRFWQLSMTAGLITPTLATQIQAMATTYHLPADFVAGLQPVMP